QDPCIALLVLCLVTTVVTTQPNDKLERLDDPVVGDDSYSSHEVLGRIVGGNPPSVIIRQGASGALTTPTSTAVKRSTMPLMPPQNMRVQGNFPPAGASKKKPVGSLTTRPPTRRPSGTAKPESSNWHPVVSSSGTSVGSAMSGRPGQQNPRPVDSMEGLWTSSGAASGSGKPTRHDSSAGLPPRPQGSLSSTRHDQKRPAANRPTLNGPHRPLETGTSQQTPNYRPKSPDVQPHYRPSASVPDRPRPVDVPTSEEGGQGPGLSGIDQGRRGIGTAGPQYSGAGPPVSGPGISGQGYPASEFSGSGHARPGFSGQGHPGLSDPGLSSPERPGTGQLGPGYSGPGISAPGLSGSRLPGPGFSGPGGIIGQPQAGFPGILPQPPQNPALYPDFQFGAGSDLPFGAGLFNLGVVNIQKAVAAAAAGSLGGNFGQIPGGFGQSSTFGQTTSFSYSDGRAAAKKR
ncbi:unnamed protein product, partial [Ixodes hexagonus]